MRLAALNKRISLEGIVKTNTYVQRHVRNKTHKSIKQFTDDVIYLNLFWISFMR